MVVTGGTLRRLQHSLVNPLGTVLLEQLNAAIAFIGCNGVDVGGGVTNVILPADLAAVGCDVQVAADAR